MTDTMVTHADTTLIGENAPKRRRRIRNFFSLRSKTKATIGYGLLSAALYYGLYYFNDDIRAAAEITNQGDRTLFFMPIVLAFLFSVVHGIFTDRFWESLGVRAKR